MKRVVILFAHGSRDPRWSRPFKRLASLLSTRFLVRVAYLEFMRPSLEQAAAKLAAAGVRSVQVVPVFVGSGRHLKRDLARNAAALRKRYPGMRIAVKRAIGEDPRVIQAIASAIAAAIRPSSH